MCISSHIAHSDEAVDEFVIYLPDIIFWDMFTLRSRCVCVFVPLLIENRVLFFSQYSTEKRQTKKKAKNYEFR